MVKTVKKVAKKPAGKPAAKKVAKRSAAPVRKTAKKTEKKSPKKSARKNAGTALTKLERAIYERMVEIDELAADMGLLGAVEPAPKKTRKKR